MRSRTVHVDAVCTKCKQPKRPRRGYLALLMGQGLPYVCMACRLGDGPQPMKLGKLGTL